jgi:hypothetical protein
MTTKNDLLRDLLKDLLINLDYNFDPTNDGSPEGAEIILDEKIEEMLSVMEDFDQNATNQDFTVKVVMDKPNKYAGLEVFPGIKESLDNLSIRIS